MPEAGTQTSSAHLLDSSVRFLEEQHHPLDLERAGDPGRRRGLSADAF